MAPKEDDYGFRGFFELRTPQDLFKKLEHDFARLKQNPVDSYAAFDFFVTANHMVDWFWPSATRSQQKDNRRSDVLPRICEHLADGAKHFLLLHPHQGVESTTRSEGLFDDNVFDPAMFDVGELVVTLESAEASELGKPTIAALDLAERVLKYWAKRIGIHAE